MGIFECGFAGNGKDHIRMVDDLDQGWKKLDKGWGFWGQDFLDYRGSKFRCRLYLLAKAAEHYESRKTFNGQDILDPMRVGAASVTLNGLKLLVELPISSRIYEIAEDLFSVASEEGSISYRFQVWLNFQGEPSMLVKDEYDFGDGRALIGGRPESNRRKF